MSLDNLFGDAAAPSAGATAAPVAKGGLDDLFGDKTTAPSVAARPGIDNLFHTPVPAALPKPQIGMAKPQMVDSLIPKAKPADTSNALSKFVSHVSSSFSKAIEPPDPNTMSTDVTKNTLRYFPSELARAVPGVADIQDNPEVYGKYLQNSDFLKSVPQASLDTAKGLVKAPITAGADLWDTARVYAGQKPNAVFNVPGLGEIKSDVFNFKDAIDRGENPWIAGLSTMSSTIFNTLFFADVVSRVTSPRSVKIAETTGNVNDITPSGDSGPRPTIDPGPKSGRLYEQPTAYARNAPQYIPPEAAEKLNLGKNFVPTQPVFYKMTIGKGGTYTGEIFQIKPSYLNTAYEKLFGNKPQSSVPALLGAPQEPITSKLTPVELATIAHNASPEDTTTLHSKTVTGSSVKESIQSTIDTHTPAAPITPKPPAPTPSTAYTVAHNILRLGQGDTSKAGKAADMLLQETKKAIDEHGEPAAHQALVNQVGVDEGTAHLLISEAKTPQSLAEVRATHGAIADSVLSGRSDEQIKNDAIAHVEKNSDHLIQSYIKEHGNFVGADEAKEFMPGYSKDRSLSDIVQKGASQLADKVYSHLLEKREGEGNNTVLITAGGTGSGKSTALRGGGIDPKEYSVVFDSNLTDVKTGISRIQQALDHGYNVDIHYVYAHPESAYDRAIERSERMAQEKGSGRPVSPQGHIDMHHKSYDSVPAIMEHFKDEPRVRIAASDNSGESPVLIKHPLDFIKEKGDNRSNETELHDKLQSQREKAFSEGRISERTNAAYDRAGELRPRREEPPVQQQSQEGSKDEAGNVLKLPTTVDEMVPYLRAKYPDGIKLFHQTSTDAAASIKENGFEGDDEGHVYFSVEKYDKGRNTGSDNSGLIEITLNPADYIDIMPDPGAGYDLNDDTESVEDAEIEALFKEGFVGSDIVLPDDVATAALNGTFTREAYKNPIAGSELKPAQKADVKNVVKLLHKDAFLAQLLETDTKSQKERGFVNPGQVAEDIAAAAAKVKDTIDKIENARELTGDVRAGIYQHENARKAMRVRLTRMLEEVGGLLDAEGWETLYHHDENKSEKLSSREQQIYDQFIVPIKRGLTDTITKYREAGGTITPDLFFMSEGEYTPRFAKDKQSALDKLIEAGSKKIKSIKNGGSLAQSLGTVGKSRKFYAAVAKDGTRHVVYVPTDKGENVLAFKDGKIEDLGPVKGLRSPKVKEYFDATVMRKLNDLAESLGIEHERVATGKSKGLGYGTAGVSFKGVPIVKTRLSPTSVLAHELGHQIDNKYGLQDFMEADRFDAQHKREIKAEMRALADKRFEGMMVNKTFKHYVRSGPERMAVMFEAYISNREMFKEVAPHLYDDFRQFLRDHDELAPFLDIRPGVTLGSDTHGGEQSGKIGAKFVDKNKNEYTIGQATTREIETHTNVEYHKNVLANYVVALDKAQNAYNAMKLLERLKSEEEFGTIIKKDSPDEASPEGWKSIGDQLPQFRGYHMEPRVAEALIDLAGRQNFSPIPVVDSINNFLVSAILINPIMHIPNVLAGRSVAAAAGDVSTGSLKNLHTAINEVRNKGDLYLKYLEHGAPFMHLKDVTHKFSDAVFNQYTQEVESDPTRWQEISDMLGYANPKKMTDALWKLNEDITWGSNDVFFMHALLDYRDAKGGTMEDAVREVSKYMADYRVPERILLPGAAGRALSQLAQSRLFLFGRFHYTGVIRPWIAAARDGATGTTQQRMAGLGALAYMLIMGLAVWPYLNKMWQGVTGSPTSYESMPGPFKVVETAGRLHEQGTSAIPRAVQSMFTPSPALKSAIELGFNTDLFTKNPIYGGPTAEGSKYLISIISPLASASRMTPGDFALSLFGVWTPKNTPAKTELQHMKYDELPMLQGDIKKMIVAGDIDKANDQMVEYNTRAVATWNQYQLETGGKPLQTDAEKQAFLKEWGIKAPGEKALANAAANYGDGSLTNKSSLLDTVTTYAKAVGVDPATAFERIFSGQKIVRVTNFGLFNPDSAIIVQRMPFDASEAVRKQLGATEGMQLDHVIPLEAGGSNDRGNLNLITAQQDGGDQQKLENLLGDAVKQGKISQEKVREYAIRYKVGNGQTLPAEYMDEFKNKYDGKPLTLAEIYDAIKKGDAK